MSGVARLACLRKLCGGLVVRVGAIVLLVRAILLGDGVLMMPGGHALPRRDSGHALDGDGQGQQKHSKKAEEIYSHRRAL